MKYYLSLLLLSTLFAPTANCQATYLKTNKALLVGIEFVDFAPAKNTSYIEILNKATNQVLKFTPGTCQEFKTASGDVYLSKHLPTDTTRYFFERLASGRINLLALHSAEGIKYYIDEPNGYYALLKNDSNGTGYKQVIENLLQSCPEVKNLVNYTRFTKNDLTHIFSLYNSCGHNRRQNLNFGFVASWVNTRYYVSEKFSSLPITEPNFTYHSSYAVGATIDIPLTTKGLTLHNEVLFSYVSGTSYFSTHAYLFEVESPTQKHKMDYSNFYVSFPVLFRYTYPENRLRPYINIGPLVTFNLISSTEFQPKIENSFGEEKLNFAPFNINMALGIGAAYRMNNHQDIWFGIRTSYSLNQVTDELKMTQYSLSVGYTL